MTEDHLDTLGITEYCPTRRQKRGRKPNLTGQAELNTMKRQKRLLWLTLSNQAPTEETRKVMLTQAIKIAVNVVMSI